MSLLPTYAINHAKRTLIIEDESGPFGQHFMRTYYTLRGYKVDMVDSLKKGKLEQSL